MENNQRKDGEVIEKRDLVNSPGATAEHLRSIADRFDEQRDIMLVHYVPGGRRDVRVEGVAIQAEILIAGSKFDQARLIMATIEQTGIDPMSFAMACLELRAKNPNKQHEEEE